MNRLYLSLILCLFVFSCSGKNQKIKPNIVIILADDQGWGDLSINGNTNIETPNIDNLAKQGVTFDRFYVCAVCSPTRAELLTGRSHVRGGVYATSTGGERLDLDETTIAEVLKKEGYVTAAYGKWHNGMQPPYHPNARGFDDFYGFCSGHWGNYFSPMLEHNGKIVTGKGYLTDDFTDYGIEFIEKNKEKPFFLYLPFNTPHSPYQVPDDWWNKFESKDLNLFHRDPHKENIPETKAALAMCENIDWNVGRIINTVEKLGIAENTLIIYFSDNGPNTWRWNQGMKGKKGSTDEGGVRSPLIMKWDGHFKPGKNISQIASILDIFPTLTDLSEINYQSEKELDGKSLKPLLLDENNNWEDRIIINYWRNSISARNQQYRMDNEGQLFDMLKDPGQTTDIANKKPEIASELSRAIEIWRTQVLIELPQTDTRPFTIGAPGFSFSQIPARDGIATGNIKRSANSPNCTFFTNWTNINDSIYWPVEVLTSGDYQVQLYYTCPAADVGSTIKLSFGNNHLVSEIKEAHNPQLKGMENDRILRTQSYVKDFKKINMGTITLEKGKGILALKALKIPETQVMDFRLLMFEKI